ncbi:MAG: hypothetical protein ACLR76_02495 [Alistipes sp.]
MHGLTSGTSYTLIVQAFNGEYKKIEVLTQSTCGFPESSPNCSKSCRANGPRR